MSVAEQQSGVFACPFCEVMFEAPLSFDPSRKCPECNLLVAAPSIKNQAGSYLRPRQGREGAISSQRETYASAPISGEGPDENYSDLMSREYSKRKKESSSVMKVLVTILAFAFVAVATGLVLYYFELNKSETSQNSSLVDSEGQDEARKELANQSFIRGNIKECQNVLMGYMRKRDPSEIGAYVANSSGALEQRRLHYIYNSFITYEGNPKLRYANVINIGERKAIETMWSWPNGILTDAVFVRGAGWKIDWLQMVRFSEQSLSAFSSGFGDVNEGVFRLYARRAKVDEGEDVRWVTVSFYEPKRNLNAEYRKPLVKVIVDRTSEIGREFEAVYENRKAGLGAYGGKAFGVDPEDLIRVTVKLKRSREENGKVSVELSEIISNHWLTHQGVDLEVEP